MFAELAANTRKDTGIVCHRLAVGSRPGTATIYLTHHSTTSSLIKPEDSVAAEDVEITTLSDFVDREAIATIDLLKVDAEGFDLEVLRGAEALLIDADDALASVEVVEAAYADLRRSHWIAVGRPEPVKLEPVASGAEAVA